MDTKKETKSLLVTPTRTGNITTQIHKEMSVTELCTILLDTQFVVGRSSPGHVLYEFNNMVFSMRGIRNGKADWYFITSSLSEEHRKNEHHAGIRLVYDSLRRIETGKLDGFQFTVPAENGEQTWQLMQKNGYFVLNELRHSLTAQVGRYFPALEHITTLPLKIHPSDKVLPSYKISTPARRAIRELVEMVYQEVVAIDTAETTSDSGEEYYMPHDSEEEC